MAMPPAAGSRYTPMPGEPQWMIDFMTKKPSDQPLPPPNQSFAPKHPCGIYSPEQVNELGTYVIRHQTVPQINQEKYGPSTCGLWACVPLVGTIIGIVRIFVALSQLAPAVMLMINEWRSKKPEDDIGPQLKLDNSLFHSSLCSLGRGFIELIPIIGGVGLYFVDRNRLNAANAKARDQLSAEDILRFSNTSAS